MPPILPQIIGILAVASFLLSYQLKSRRSIILLNVLSRALYILQYLLLGAFSGAVLDVLGAVSSVIAARKDHSFLKKHTAAVLIAINTVIVIAGLLLYENVYSLLPIIGVLLHTSAFWISDEKSSAAFPCSARPSGSFTILSAGPMAPQSETFLQWCRLPLP